MAGFMPSEIARLVLGYLKEKKCENTYKTFLSESPVLQEYQELLDRGREYPTTYAGKSLLSILDEYYTLTVKGGVPSSSKNSDQVQPSAASSKPHKEAQSSDDFRSHRIRTRSVITSRSNGDSPVQSTRPHGCFISPSNVFSSPYTTPSKGQVRTKLVFETPKNLNQGKAETCEILLQRDVCSEIGKSGKVGCKIRNAGTSCHSAEGTSKGHLTEPAKQKSSLLASSSKHSVSDYHRTSSGSDQVAAVHSVSAPGTIASTSSLYINSSVQTSLSFISSKTDSSLEAPFTTHTALNASFSPVHSAKDNQTVFNSPDIRFSSSPLRTTGPCDKNKLPDGIYNHSSNSTEGFLEARSCSRPDAAPAQLSAEKNSVALTSSSSLAFAMTPDSNQEPPPYCRAPATNSPRITLSLERSVIPSLTTPMKQLCGIDAEFRSPKRKSLIPRRRLISESSPVFKQCPESNNLMPVVDLSDDTTEHWACLEDFMPLIDKLTENINIVKSSESNVSDQQTSKPSERSPSKSAVPEDVVYPQAFVENVLRRTESDPLFEDYVAYLSEKFDPNMVFLSPFRRPPPSSDEERNVRSVTRKLNISDEQNQASGGEVSENKCCSSSGDQQQLANKKRDISEETSGKTEMCKDSHSTSNHYSYDGGGSIVLVDKQSSNHSLNNIVASSHSVKETDQSKEKVGEICIVAESQQNSPSAALSISGSIATRGSSECENHRVVHAGNTNSVEAQKTYWNQENRNLTLGEILGGHNNDYQNQETPNLPTPDDTLGDHNDNYENGCVSKENAAVNSRNASEPQTETLASMNLLYQLSTPQKSGSESVITVTSVATSHTNSAAMKTTCMSLGNEKVVTLDAASLGVTDKDPIIYQCGSNTGINVTGNVGTPLKLQTGTSPKYTSYRLSIPEGYKSPFKLQIGTPPKQLSVAENTSSSPLKLQTGTSTCQSYQLSHPENNQSPSVLFVPQCATQVSSSSPAFLIIQTTGNYINGLNNVITQPPAPCAEVEMVTICEDQVVSTESSLVPVVSSVPQTQTFSVLGSNTSNENFWVPGNNSQTVSSASTTSTPSQVICQNLYTSDIQYVSLASSSQQNLSSPVPIAIAPPGQVHHKKYYPLKKKGRTKTKTEDDAVSAAIRANVLKDLNLCKQNKKRGRPRKSAPAESEPVAVCVADAATSPPTNRAELSENMSTNRHHSPVKRTRGKEGKVSTTLRCSPIKRTRQNEDRISPSKPLKRTKCDKTKSSPKTHSTPPKREKQSEEKTSPNRQSTPTRRAKQNEDKISPSKRKSSLRTPKGKTPPHSQRQQTEEETLRSSVVASFDAIKKNSTPKLKSLISSVRQYFGTSGVIEKSHVRALNFGHTAENQQTAEKGKSSFTNKDHNQSNEKEALDKEVLSASPECPEIIDLTSPRRTRSQKEPTTSMPHLVFEDQEREPKAIEVQHSALSNEADKSPLKKRVLRSHAKEISKLKMVISQSPNEELVTPEQGQTNKSSTETIFSLQKTFQMEYDAHSPEQTATGSHSEELAVQKATVSHNSGARLATKEKELTVITISLQETPSKPSLPCSPKQTISDLHSEEFFPKLTVPGSPDGELDTEEKEKQAFYLQNKTTHTISKSRELSAVGDTSRTRGQTASDSHGEESFSKASISCSRDEGLDSVEKEKQAVTPLLAKQAISRPPELSTERSTSHPLEWSASDSCCELSHKVKTDQCMNGELATAEKDQTVKPVSTKQTTSGSPVQYANVNTSCAVELTASDSDEGLTTAAKGETAFPLNAEQTTSISCESHQDKDSSNSSEQIASDLHGGKLPSKETVVKTLIRKRLRPRKAQPSVTLTCVSPSKQSIEKNPIKKRLQPKKGHLVLKTSRMKNSCLESYFERSCVNRMTSDENETPPGKTTVGSDSLEQAASDSHAEVQLPKENNEKNSVSERECQKNEQQTVTVDVEQSVTSPCEVVPREGDATIGLQHGAANLLVEKSPQKESSDAQGMSKIPAATDKQADNTDALCVSRSLSVCCLCCQKINEINEDLSQSAENTLTYSPSKFDVTDSSTQVESVSTQTENWKDKVGNGSYVKRFNETANQTPDSVSASKALVKKADLKAQRAELDEGRSNQPTPSTSGKCSAKKDVTVSSSKTLDRNPVERRGRKRKVPPSIPAGVKLPQKWDPKTVDVYSDAISNTLSSHPSKRQKSFSQRNEDQVCQKGKEKLRSVKKGSKKNMASSKKSQSPKREKSRKIMKKKSSSRKLVYSSDDSGSRTPSPEDLEHATSSRLYSHSKSTTEKEPPPRKRAISSSDVYTSSICPINEKQNKLSVEHSSSHSSPVENSSPSLHEDYDEVQCAVAFLKQSEKQLECASVETPDSVTEIGCELTLDKSPSFKIRSHCNSTSIFDVGDTKNQKTSLLRKKKKQHDVDGILKKIEVTEFLDQIHE